MKQHFLALSVLLVSITASAQFSNSAPWMKELTKNKQNNDPTKKQTSFTFQEIVNAFNTYWEDKDHTVKGSGYKPFKRWENYWRDALMDDGSIMPPTYEWDIIQQKQQQKKQLADQSDWVALGPTNFLSRSSSSANIGRINVLTIDPNDNQVYYAGTPAGGMWKSTDAGITWMPMTDQLPQIGVSAIAIDPTDSNTIYIGTGDDDAYDTFSVGVLKSTDGGRTWNTTGLSIDRSYQDVNEIYIDPRNTDVIYVSTSQGFYKSTDAGVTFTSTLREPLKDIKLKPDDASVIYAVTNDKMFKSTDSGETFTQITAGLPTSSGRLALGVSPAAPEYVYIFSAQTDTEEYAFQGIYKSTDAGDTFVKTANDKDLCESNQAWYDFAFAVSDKNADELYTGVLDVWKSTDGGDDFVQINEWHKRNKTYTHADIHFLRFYDGVLFCGSDGGIFRSKDQAATFQDITNGMQIGQFYKVAVAKQYQQSERITGGTQDNGNFGFTNYNTWDVFGFGDGMDAAIHPNNPNLYYGFMQYGANLWVSSDAGVTLTGIIKEPDPISGPDDPDGQEFFGGWVTPLKASKEGEIYAAYNAIFKVEGNKFVQVSPKLSTSKGIDEFEIDPSNTDIMYVSLGAELSKSTDRGVSFSKLFTFNRRITSIAIHSEDSNIVYATTSGTRGKILKSTNGGKDFEDITGNLPALPKLMIKHQAKHSQNPLFVGTSIGVYRTDDSTSGVWEVFENNLPNVPIRDLEINENDGNITAATYGRGIWRSPIPIEEVTNDLAIQRIEKEQINCGVSTATTIKVLNKGIEPINSVTINIKDTSNGDTWNETWTGTINPTEEATIDLPVLDLGIGVHVLEIKAAILDDGNTENNELTEVFLQNTQGKAGVNDFENPADEMLVVGGVWELGEPKGTQLDKAASGNNVYGTNLSGNYPNSSVGRLVSGCYDMTRIENPILTFKMAFDLEEEWDFMNVEYSIDGGVTWDILGTANDSNWYNSDAVPTDRCFNCPGAQWTGVATTMQSYSYDLAAYTAADNFMFRFNLVTDEATTQEGVVIDDVEITGNFLSVATLDAAPNFSVYPNPSNAIFTIQWQHATEASYDVYDLTGKRIVSVLKLDDTTGISTVDLSAYSKGVYFMDVTVNGAKKTIKLVKK